MARQTPAVEATSKARVTASSASFILCIGALVKPADCSVWESTGIKPAKIEHIQYRASCVNVDHPEYNPGIYIYIHHMYVTL